MNDWQQIIVAELKAINRKLERLEDNTNNNLRDLEQDISAQLGPIKKHVTQVKFASVLIPSLITLAGVISRLLP